jgi:hypothetical protein
MSLIAIQNAAKTTLMKAQMDTRKTGGEPEYAPRECHVARHPCEDCARKRRNCPVIGIIADYAKSCIHKHNAKAEGLR